MARPTLIDLNPDEKNPGLYHYPFTFRLDRCDVSCNTIDDPSSKTYVPNKTEEANLNVFNMVAGINE